MDKNRAIYKNLKQGLVGWHRLPYLTLSIRIVKDSQEMVPSLNIQNKAGNALLTKQPINLNQPILLLTYRTNHNNLNY